MWRNQELWNEIKSLGRTTSYYHKINLSYTLPINKIPVLDWVTLNGRYNGTFGWDAGPRLDTIELGNVIKNSYTIQLNGQMNFVNLYNKSGYLKSINDKYRSNSGRGRGRPQQRQSQQETRTKEKTFTQDGIYFREGSARFVTHNLRSEDLKVTIRDEAGQEVDSDYEILSNKRIKVTAAATTRNATLEIIATKQLGEDPFTFILENSVRMLMAVRTVNLTYSMSGGTMLPGFTPKTRVVGMERLNGQLTPGWEYISGWYKGDFAQEAFYNGWLTYDQALNDPFNQNQSERLNFRANVEPLKGLRIDVTGNMNRSYNATEFYTADEFGRLPDREDRGFVSSGNFSMSYFSWGSAFEQFNENADSSSAAFDFLKFEARQIISQRLGQAYNASIDERNQANQGLEQLDRLVDSAGYYEGYGPTSQEVLIPAFLAAYGYQEPGNVPLKAVQGLLNVMPNWKITYDGLGKIEALQEWVSSITINHSYRSTYSIGSYLSNPYYEEILDGVPIQLF